MSTPERERVYLDLGNDLIVARTPVEFRQLLDLIRTRAGLTPSQIAIKTAIPRSQAYNMVATSRTTLPSKRDQVREFVEACGLAPVQVALVLDLWAKLDQEGRELAAKTPLSPGDKNAVPSTTGGQHHINVLSNEVSAPSAVFGGVRRSRRDASYRPRAFIDLVFLVLEDDLRTRRAVLLLRTLASAIVLIVVIVGIFVLWAARQPDHALIVGAAFAAAAVLSKLASTMRRTTRRRRKRSLTMK